MFTIFFFFELIKNVFSHTPLETNFFLFNSSNILPFDSIKNKNFIDTLFFAYHHQSMKIHISIKIIFLLDILNYSGLTFYFFSLFHNSKTMNFSNQKSLIYKNSLFAAFGEIPKTIDK
jgi:hypothetical protein